jgi:Uma2 family endonuclease
MHRPRDDVQAVALTSLSARHPHMATAALRSLSDDPRPIEVPRDAYRLDGYRRWALSPAFPQRGKISFLGGLVSIDMSPEDIGSHSPVKTAVVVALGVFARSTQQGEAYTDGVFFVSEVADLATEPDALFLLHDSVKKKRVRFVAPKDAEMELHGQPDLVVEVVSASSLRKDTQILVDAYYRAGVREYWLIDARAGRLDFTLLVRGAKKFRAARVDKNGFAKSPVLGRRVKLTEGLNPLGRRTFELLIEE